jgi:hypothetical protein
VQGNFQEEVIVNVSLLQLVVHGLVKDSKMEEAKKLEHLGKFNKYTRYSMKLSSARKVPGPTMASRASGPTTSCIFLIIYIYIYIITSDMCHTIIEVDVAH